MKVAKLDDQLCFALYQASNSLVSVYRPLLEPLGLTYPQFIVLMALWEEEEISISKLADRVGLGKATMSTLLKRLEQKELITREFLAGNERQKNIALTKKGRDVSQSSAEVTERAFCATGLSRGQANKLIEQCNKVVDQINEHRSEE